jgi:hypothetical protein
MAEQVRGRCSNLRQEDRCLIVELVVKHQSIVENKRTDLVTNKQKEAAWQQIELEFNAISTAKRTWVQLKQVSL